MVLVTVKIKISIQLIQATHGFRNQKEGKTLKTTSTIQSDGVVMGDARTNIDLRSQGVISQNLQHFLQSTKTTAVFFEVILFCPQQW